MLFICILWHEATTLRSLNLFDVLSRRNLDLATWEIRRASFRFLIENQIGRCSGPGESMCAPSLAVMDEMLTFQVLGTLVPKTSTQTRAGNNSKI